MMFPWEDDSDYREYSPEEFEDNLYSEYDYSNAMDFTNWFVEVVYETPRAYLFQFRTSGNKFWCPKSLCCNVKDGKADIYINFTFNILPKESVPEVDGEEIEL